MADAGLRLDRALLNLPRVIDLERRCQAAQLPDADAATHFLSRLIIGLNTVAIELSQAAAAGEAAEAARTAAAQLWDLGEKSAAISERLRVLDAGRR